MKNRVINAVFVKDKRVLLEKRKEEEDNYAGLWAFPGGHIEKGEKIEDALSREMKEELGVELGTVDFLGVIEDIDPTSKDPYEHHIFICKRWKGKLQDTKEEERIKWVDIDYVPHMRHVSKPTLDILEEL